MRIDIIAVGKLKERFWVEACAEYLKRLQPYAQVSVREVSDRSAQTCGSDEQARALEGRNIVKNLSQNAYLIVLDIQGDQLSSEQLAAKIAGLQVSSRSHIACVIGGSTGVDTPVREQADLLLSFGPVTLPHNLARVVLLEQLYRSCKIIQGEPYHK
jgi:23S rRNA (pseudouridine1915-N3)-methyltransferase